MTSLPPSPTQRHSPVVVHVVTDPMTTTFFRGQMRALTDAGYEPVVVSSPGRGLAELGASEPVEVFSVPMRRVPSPMADLKSLIRLFRFLRRRRPEVVQYSTPKASLLASIASVMARVPIRVLLVHGWRWETVSGFGAGGLRALDRVSARLATDVICVSGSVRAMGLRYRILSPARSRVLGPGSANGIDIGHFTPSRAHQTWTPSCGRPLVLGFVGRLNRDKGLADLRKAYDVIRDSLPSTELLVVGGPDPSSPEDPDILDELAALPGVTFLGQLDDVAPVYRQLDVLLSCSRREGLGTAVLEAQASGVPVVGYSCTGVVDALVDGKTGALVPVGDWRGLAAAVVGYAENPDALARHGAAARRWIVENFDQVLVHRRIVKYLDRLTAGIGPEPDERSGRS